jgi:excisionase family DNA binding protein
MAATTPRRAAPPTSAERERLQQIITLYEGQMPALRLVGPHGEPIELPHAVYEILAEVLRAMAQGQAVTVTPLDTELTTQEAADILNVSRQYLVRLLDQGTIPFTKVGTHRRVKFGDLAAYKDVRDQQRHEALTELTRLSEDLGMYDDDFIKEARNGQARRDH